MDESMDFRTCITSIASLILSCAQSGEIFVVVPQDFHCTWISMICNGDSLIAMRTGENDI